MRCSPHMKQLRVTLEVSGRTGSEILVGLGSDHSLGKAIVLSCHWRLVEPDDLGIVVCVAARLPLLLLY
jgi:hypothetical protein